MLDLATAFASFPVLATERFVLREPRPADAANLFRIMGDPRVLRYFGQLPMSTLDQAERQVESLASAFREHSGVRWVIADRATDDLLGSGGFWRILQEHDRAEIGYELAPERWGQGIMTEAVAAMLRFGFEQIGLHSVEAQIHPDNIGSRRVLEKLGFVQEGYFRENFWDPVEVRFTDTAVFSLLRSEWNERNSAASRDEVA